MTSYERYRNALHGNASEMVSSFLHNRWEDLPDIVKGITAKKVDLTQISTTGLEEYYIRLVHGFAVVDGLMTCLRDIENYLEEIPDSANRVRYLYIHVEEYLKEAAVLREKMQDYLKSIPRLYRRDTYYQQLLGSISAISVNVDRIFNEVLNVKGDSIFGSHLRDEQLDLVLAFENYPIERDATFISRSDKEFRQVKERWQAAIAEHNLKIKACLEESFGELLELIFDEDLNIKIPKGYRS